jgi:hypothetical protein
MGAHNPSPLWRHEIGLSSSPTHCLATGILRRKVAKLAGPAQDGRGKGVDPQHAQDHRIGRRGWESDASDQRSSIDRASEPVLPHVAIGGTVVPCSRCLNAGEFSDHRGRFSSASWTTLRQWMMADVLWKDRRHRLPSPHQRRHRRPAWGNGVVSLRLRPAVTFLSGRSCDFAIGDRHRQLNGGATDCAA